MTDIYNGIGNAMGEAKVDILASLRLQVCMNIPRYLSPATQVTEVYSCRHIDYTGLPFWVYTMTENKFTISAKSLVRVQRIALIMRDLWVNPLALDWTFK